MVIRILQPISRLADRLLRDRKVLGQQQAEPVRGPGKSGITSSDYTGRPEMVYERRGPGGYRAGEVVWTWVAYEEDSSQGKDRPVLLIGADEGWLLGLPATSQDHDRDAQQERQAGRYWVDIGTGEWDARRRASEVRTDRIVRIDPNTVRRTAGRVDARIFSRVASQVTRHWGD